MLPSGLVKRSVWEGTNATKVSLTLVITLKSHSHPRKAARNLHISTHSSTPSLPNKNRRNRHILMVNLKAPISEFIIDATSNQISFSCVCAMAFIVFQLRVENIAIRLTFRRVWCPQTNPLTTSLTLYPEPFMNWVTWEHHKSQMFGQLYCHYWEIWFVC